MDSLLTWLAPLATTLAALMTASNLGTRVTGWGFAVFLVGSIAWTSLGALTGQPNLVWQNVILCFLNIFGIWRWLGRQARIEEGGRTASEASGQLPGEDLFPVSLLAKAPLIGADGRSLGHAVEAMAGCRSGRIAYVVVGEGGLAGVGERLRRLNWTAARVEEDSIRVDLDQRRFEQLEELDPSDWPGR